MVSLHWEAKNQVNQMETLKVIFEKVWRTYVVPDLKKKRRGGGSEKLKTSQPSQKKILRKQIVPKEKNPNANQNKNNPRKCETTKICQGHII